MAIINEVSFNSKLDAAIKTKKFRGIAYNNANVRFNTAKRNLIKEFDNHTVTKELLQPANSYGSSELISRGNLSAFLGFPDGSIKAGELREYLSNENNIYMDEQPSISTTRDYVYYSFNVHAPTIKDVYDDPLFETPDNWSDGKSWIEIIERGLGGAAYFMFRLVGFIGSRSFFGLQNKKKLKKNQASFTKKDYVKELLNSFRARIKIK